MSKEGPMDGWVDHYWHGVPKAMAKALAQLPPEAELVGPVGQEGLDGAVLHFALVRAPRPLDLPDGLAVTPAWIGQAAVGVIA